MVDINRYCSGFKILVYFTKGSKFWVYNSGSRVMHTSLINACLAEGGGGVRRGYKFPHHFHHQGNHYTERWWNTFCTDFTKLCSSNILIVVFLFFISSHDTPTVQIWWVIWNSSQPFSSSFGAEQVFLVFLQRKLRLDPPAAVVRTADQQDWSQLCPCWVNQKDSWQDSGKNKLATLIIQWSYRSRRPWILGPWS